jgi:DNA-directed RNA polymerase beta subunit
VGLALVVVEEHARRAVHLRDDDALGAVDDEGAVAFEQPKYDVDECRQRGITFAAPLKVTLRLIVFDVLPLSWSKNTPGERCICETMTRSVPLTMKVPLSVMRPKYDVDECRQRGITFAAPLKVTLRLIVFDVDPDTGAKSNTMSRSVTLSGAAKVMPRWRHSSTSYFGCSKVYRTNSSSAVIREVAEMPNLIEVQKASYDQFLMVDEPEGGRADEGLQSVFKSVFPISDFASRTPFEPR